jgi:hypothetical protein
MSDWADAAIAFVAGAIVCLIATAVALRRPPAKLIRTNVDGYPVPAVLGWGVVAGIVAGHLTLALMEYIDVVRSQCTPGEVCDLILVAFHWDLWGAFLVLSIGMFVVGLWDDFKGDERPRGFSGHLTSLRQARLTGGLVKLTGGALTALITTWLLAEGSLSLAVLVLAAACIALSANAINLFDRAPGRAGKVFLLVAVPLAVLGEAGSALLLGGAVGAVVVALPFDLKARAMLGDAGANPLGAWLGLGLAINLGSSTSWLVVVVVALLALNLASERWSFSEVIANNRWLARMDHLGRK